MFRKFLFILLIFSAIKWNLFAEEDSLLSDDSKRIQQIQTYLDSGKTRAQLWWYGWTGFYTGAAIFSFTMAALSDNRTSKIFQNVQAFESLVGTAGLLIFPFPAKSAADKLKVMPQNTEEEQIAKLREAEDLLEKSARAEIGGRSWLQHSLAFLVNATGSIVIWKGYEKTIKENGDNPLTQALINLVLGTAVAELQIWTQPTKAIRDWKEYRDRYNIPRGTGFNLQMDFFACPVESGTIAGVRFRF